MLTSHFCNIACFKEGNLMISDIIHFIAIFGNYFKAIYRIKHFFLGNIVIYEARGQVILPEGR